MPPSRRVYIPEHDRTIEVPSDIVNVEEYIEAYKGALDRRKLAQQPQVSSAIKRISNSIYESTGNRPTSLETKSSLTPQTLWGLSDQNLADIPSALSRGLVGIPSGLLQGIGGLTEYVINEEFGDFIRSGGKALSEWSYNAFPVEDEQAFWTSQLPSGFGQYMGFGLAGLVTAAATKNPAAVIATVSGMGSALQLGEAWDKIEEHEDQYGYISGSRKLGVVAAATLIGASEGVLTRNILGPLSPFMKINKRTHGKFLSNFSKQSNKPKTPNNPRGGSTVSNALVSGFEESVQEMSQQFGWNYTQKNLLKLEQDLWEGVLEGGLIGQITGTTMGYLSPSFKKLGPYIKDKVKAETLVNNIKQDVWIRDFDSKDAKDYSDFINENAATYEQLHFLDSSQSGTILEDTISKQLEKKRAISTKRMKIMQGMEDTKDPTVIPDVPKDPNFERLYDSFKDNIQKKYKSIPISDILDKFEKTDVIHTDEILKEYFTEEVVKITDFPKTSDPMLQKISDEYHINQKIWKDIISKAEKMDDQEAVQLYKRSAVQGIDPRSIIKEHPGFYTRGKPGSKTYIRKGRKEPRWYHTRKGYIGEVFAPLPEDVPESFRKFFKESLKRTILPGQLISSKANLEKLKANLLGDVAKTGKNPIFKDIKITDEPPIGQPITEHNDLLNNIDNVLRANPEILQKKPGDIARKLGLTSENLKQVLISSQQLNHNLKVSGGVDPGLPPKIFYVTSEKEVFHLGSLQLPEIITLAKEFGIEDITLGPTRPKRPIKKILKEEVEEEGTGEKSDILILPEEPPRIYSEQQSGNFETTGRIDHSIRISRGSTNNAVEVAHSLGEYLDKIQTMGPKQDRIYEKMPLIKKLVQAKKFQDKVLNDVSDLVVSQKQDLSVEQIKELIKNSSIPKALITSFHLDSNNLNTLYDGINRLYKVVWAEGFKIKKFNKPELFKAYQKLIAELYDHQELVESLATDYRVGGKIGGKMRPLTANEKKYGAKEKKKERQRKIRETKFDIKKIAELESIQSQMMEPSSVYADIFSVMLNDPAVLLNVAPTITELFFTGLKVNDPALYETFQETMKELTDHNETYQAAVLRQKEITEKNILTEPESSLKNLARDYWDQLMVRVVDKNWNLLRIGDKIVSKFPDVAEGSAKWNTIQNKFVEQIKKLKLHFEMITEEHPYVGNQLNRYNRELQKEIIKPLEDLELPQFGEGKPLNYISFFGTYLFWKRLSKYGSQAELMLAIKDSEYKDAINWEEIQELQEEGKVINWEDIKIEIDSQLLLPEGQRTPIRERPREEGEEKGEIVLTVETLGTIYDKIQMLAQNYDVDSANTLLKKMKDSMKPKQFRAVEELANKFFEIRKEFVFPLLEAKTEDNPQGMGFLSKEQIGIMKDNPEYARWNVGQLMDSMLINPHSSLTSLWQKTEGNFGKNIDDTFIATMVNDQKLIGAANNNEWRRAFIDFERSYQKERSLRLIIPGMVMDNIKFSGMMPEIKSMNEDELRISKDLMRSVYESIGVQQGIPLIGKGSGKYSADTKNKARAYTEIMKLSSEIIPDFFKVKPTTIEELHINAKRFLSKEALKIMAETMDNLNDLTDSGILESSAMSFSELNGKLNRIYDLFETNFSTVPAVQIILQKYQGDIGFSQARLEVPVEVLKKPALTEKEKYDRQRGAKPIPPPQPLAKGDPPKALMSFLVDGKQMFYYVDQDIANVFHHSPVISNAAVQLLKKITGPIRQILVSRNPLFQMRNIPRDFFETAKKLPEISSTKDVLKLAGYYYKATKEIWRYIRPFRFFSAGPADIQVSPDISFMQQARMYPDNVRAWNAADQSHEEQLKRIIEQTSQLSDTVHNESQDTKKGLPVLKRLFSTLDSLGIVSEMMGKVSSFKFQKYEWGRKEIEKEVQSYKEDNPQATRKQVRDYKKSLEGSGKYDGPAPWFSRSTPEDQRTVKDVAHKVRVFSGTPDVFAAGTLTHITNSMFLFSNMRWQGLRSTVRSVKYSPSVYIWKTLIYNILPVLLIDYLQGEDPDEKRKWNNIPEYEKDNYLIIPLPNPLGLTEDGKTRYFKIPLDYEGQYWNKVTRQLINSIDDNTRVWESLGKSVGGRFEEILSVQGQSWNPIYKTIIQPLLSYYAVGMNPIDSFTGRPILSSRAFRVGGTPAFGGLARHMWNQMGGRNLVYLHDTEYQDARSTVDKIKTVFPFNMLNVFYKESNYGQSEILRRRQEILKGNKAQQFYKTYHTIKNNRPPGEPYNKKETDDLYVQMLKWNIWEGREPPTRNQFHRQIATFPSGDIFIDSLIHPNMSQEEKGKILFEIRKSLPARDFQKVYDELENRNIINSKFGLSNYKAALQSGDISYAYYHLMAWALEYGDWNKLQRELFRMNPYYFSTPEHGLWLLENVKKDKDFANLLKERAKDWKKYIRYTKKYFNIMRDPSMRDIWRQKFIQGVADFPDMDQPY